MSVLDGALNLLFEAWKGFWGSDGVTLLLVGVVIGFVGSIALGFFAQSRRGPK